MLYALENKPSVCPVCDREILDFGITKQEMVSEVTFKCGCTFERTSYRAAKGVYRVLWVCTAACENATQLALEMRYGGRFIPGVPLYKQLETNATLREDQRK